MSISSSTSVVALGFISHPQKRNWRAEELRVLVVNPELMLDQVVLGLEHHEGEVQVDLQCGEPQP